jgi:hypothetical protein
MSRKRSRRFSSQDVILREGPPPWLSSALAEIARIATLPPGWDGYGSPQLSVEEWEQAIQLLASITHSDLSAPNIVPVSGGGIQIEWQHCGRELELEIVAGAREVIFLQVYGDGTTEEGSYPIADVNKTRALLAWLVIG